MAVKAIPVPVELFDDQPPTSQREALIGLLLMARGSNDGIKPSNRQLARLWGLNRKTVDSAVNKAIESGALERTTDGALRLCDVKSGDRLPTLGPADGPEGGSQSFSRGTLNQGENPVSQGDRCVSEIPVRELVHLIADNVIYNIQNPKSNTESDSMSYSVSRPRENPEQDSESVPPAKTPKKRSPSPKYSRDSEPYELAKLLHERLREVHGPVIIPERVNRQKWAGHLDWCLKTAGGSEQLGKFVKWALTDDFWKDVLVSAWKLWCNLKKIMVAYRKSDEAKAERGKEKNREHERKAIEAGGYYLD